MEGGREGGREGVQMIGMEEGRRGKGRNKREREGEGGRKG